VFLKALADDHSRKNKFLKLRLTNVSSSYDAAEIKKKFEEKMIKTRQERMMKKGQVKQQEEESAP